MSIAAPSLTLRALLKSTASRAGLGGTPELVTGLTASAQALAVASAAAVSPAVLVVPTDSDVEVMTSDTRFFFAALQGLPESEVVRAVLPFPSLEVDPYRAIVPHLDVASARARALIGLAQGTARLVVASAPALLPRVTAPERLLRATRELVLGGELSPSDLGDLLVDAGFMPEDPVDEHGEFCIRGGVVDFFPAGESYPIRVEFVGDLIESLRQFDPGSQRSVTTIDRAAVIPLRETLEREREDLDDPEVLDRRSSVLEYLSATTTRTFVSDLEECDRRATRAVDQIGESYAAATKRGESPPDPTALLIAWADIRAHFDSGGRFEMLGLDDDDALPHRPFMAGLATGSRQFGTVGPQGKPSCLWRRHPGAPSGSLSSCRSTSFLRCLSTWLRRLRASRCSSPLVSCREGFAFRMRGYRYMQRPTFSTKSDEFVTGESRWPRRSCPTFATSKWGTRSSTLTMASVGSWDSLSWVWEARHMS